MHNEFNIAIVGGGIVGLATAYKIQSHFPELKIIVFEKEKEFFIKYVPTKKKILKKYDKKDYSNNPFGVLNQLNLK